MARATRKMKTAIRVCSVPVLDIKRTADAGSETTSQLLYGEQVRLLEQANEWCTVEAMTDGYRGYVQHASLTGPPSPGKHPAPATHRVATRATFLFPTADMKQPPLARLPFGARLTLTDDEPVDGYRRTAEDGWMRATHAAPVAEPLALSALEIARSRFLGAPYLWGGRTPDGCDCSGLVQAAAAGCGRALPRDSGEQERFVSTSIDAGNELEVDDLVFWPGHVAIYAGDGQVLHANAWTLSVTIETLDAVSARAGEPSSIRRPG